MDYNFEAFEWFIPEERSLYALTIPNQKTLRINPRLMEKLSERIEIGISNGGSLIAIRENPSGFRPPKCGTLKKSASRIIKHLTALGVRFPARYAMSQSGNVWIGVLDEQELPSLQEKKSTKKPADKDLSGLLNEVLRV